MRKFRNKWNQLTVDVETLMKNEHNKIVAEIGWTLGKIRDRGDKPLARRWGGAETRGEAARGRVAMATANVLCLKISLESYYQNHYYGYYLQYLEARLLYYALLHPA